MGVQIPPLAHEGIEKAAGRVWGSRPDRPADVAVTEEEHEG